MNVHLVWSVNLGPPVSRQFLINLFIIVFTLLSCCSRQNGCEGNWDVPKGRAISSVGDEWNCWKIWEGAPMESVAVLILPRHQKHRSCLICWKSSRLSYLPWSSVRLHYQVAFPLVWKMQLRTSRDVPLKLTPIRTWTSRSLHGLTAHQASSSWSFSFLLIQYILSTNAGSYLVVPSKNGYAPAFFQSLIHLSQYRERRCVLLSACLYDSAISLDSSQFGACSIEMSHPLADIYHLIACCVAQILADLWLVIRYITGGYDMWLHL